MASASPLRGWEAIRAADGIGICVTGTVIVFVALTAISLFIALLPHLLAALGPWLPEIHSHHDQPLPTASDSSAEQTRRLAATVAWARHQQRP
ncbi:hypothetical protein [Botrimarina hoheduenensis]|uniref:hypothetical protein n=1 Tax=Botrimarina hoheduenensis TaxID=2528000 RepID=UPI0011B606C2|nr:hypothetical protein [Botrimarina hoheduenensis]